MNARKRRLWQKRIKPVAYTFSYWHKSYGGTWEQYSRTSSTTSRSPTFRIALPGGGYVMNQSLRVLK